MNSILDNLADNIIVKLRDEENHQPHTIEAVKNIEKVIKDEIRKGAFISEQQIETMMNNLVVDGQVGLFIDNTGCSIAVSKSEMIKGIKK